MMRPPAKVGTLDKRITDLSKLAQEQLNALEEIHSAYFGLVAPAVAKKRSYTRQPCSRVFREQLSQKDISQFHLKVDCIMRDVYNSHGSPCETAVEPQSLQEEAEMDQDQESSPREEQQCVSDIDKDLLQRAEAAEIAQSESEARVTELEQQLMTMGAAAEESASRIVELEQQVCCMGATAAQSADRIYELEQCVSNLGQLATRQSEVPQPQQSTLPSTPTWPKVQAWGTAYVDGQEKLAFRQPIPQHEHEIRTSGAHLAAHGPEILVARDNTDRRASMVTPVTQMPCAAEPLVNGHCTASVRQYGTPGSSAHPSPVMVSHTVARSCTNLPQPYPILRHGWDLGNGNHAPLRE